QTFHHSFRPDAAVMRVCAAEKLVQKKQDGQRPRGQPGNQFEASDFGIETGDASLQGIEDADGCGDLEKRETKPASAHRRTALRQYGVDSRGADKGALSGHV